MDLTGIIIMVVFFLVFSGIGRALKKAFTGTQQQGKPDPNSKQNTVNSDTEEKPFRTFQQIMDEIRKQTQEVKELQKEKVQQYSPYVQKVKPVSNKQTVFREKQPLIKDSKAESIEYETKKPQTGLEQLQSERKTKYIQLEEDEYDMIDLDIKSAIIGSIIFERPYS